jgi:hypothetical protein
MMAEYIRAGLGDPLVLACADYAWRRFGKGLADPRAKAWAVFWYVKHCVKFKKDEGVMLQLGSPGEQDVLIAPSVLVRMKKPAEDCDGFTMLGSVLLAALSVPVAIVAVAVNPQQPGIWSHVFPVALIDGSLLSLDMSHGSAPGWMVPLERIQRWQAWDLNGRKISLPAPSGFAGLHDYRPARVIPVPRIRRQGGRRRGLGDDVPGDGDPSIETGGSSTLTLGGPDATFNPTNTLMYAPGSTPTVTTNAPTDQQLNDAAVACATSNGSWSFLNNSCTRGGVVTTPFGSPSSQSNANWMSSLLSGSFGLATRVLAPTTTTCNPTTGVCTTTGGSGILPSASLSALGSPSTLILLAVAFGGLMLLSSKK